MPRGRPPKNAKKAALKPAKQSSKPGRKPRPLPNPPRSGEGTGRGTVYSIRHQDKRANIPTEELRDFMVAEEKKPAVILYPRDTSLDPQLVWKGKDEQDSKDMTVPAVPVYIQEKIHPQALIENLKAESKRQKNEEVPDLFGDFNGLPKEFSDRVDFYNHFANWQNRMILGDSLLVMNSLAEKEGLKGKVQMVYIDPPYGIKFGSNWQVSTRKRDVKDSKAEDATRQPEQVKAFRDTWELGIHSYLSYMRDRLTVARELLTETGSVFVQIGDENVHLVRAVMDEVFGSDNFLVEISFKKGIGASEIFVPSVFDYLLVYAKNQEVVKYRQLFTPSTLDDDDFNFSWVESPVEGERRLNTKDFNSQGKLINQSIRFQASTLVSKGESKDSSVGFDYKGSVFMPASGSHWKTTKDGLKRLANTNRLLSSGITLTFKRYFTDYPYTRPTNVWLDTVQSTFASDKIYVVQTTTKVIERCMLMVTDPGDLVLDPTCGSGTTAYVAEQWGRRWITLDTSRVALTLARTRLMAAKYPYFHLADSPEGMLKEAEMLGTLASAKFDLSPALSRKERVPDIRRGFVYKRVPHVTLKSIANNQEIDTIYAKWQEKMQPKRAELNKAAKEKWEEWEIPRDLPEAKAEVQKLLKEWWELRLVRQKEIDDSISRHADTELLFDQPYEDNKRVRITGPFTVESLSPHRMLSPEIQRTATEAAAERDSSSIGFERMILENLKTAGVQNTVKNERMKFDRLDVISSPYLHATGEYSDKEGKSHRVAVFIGPEHGTVGPNHIKDAAKEAVKGLGHEVLIVCGFAFDPHVNEEAKRYGNLTVLVTRMNTDLTMGSEMLKKTGGGNLFMVFGEPDIQPVDRKTGKILPNKDGKIVLEIKGVDVYDPTTGEVRGHTNDDIACWFVDTNYNGESFFVRQAYFTGAGDPYDRLKKALRAEINESAWSTLYSTKSRPFDKPETGKIAVKVINHYGDEVLKVYEVE